MGAIVTPIAIAPSLPTAAALLQEQTQSETQSATESIPPTPANTTQNNRIKPMNNHKIQVEDLPLGQAFIYLGDPYIRGGIAEDRTQQDFYIICFPLYPLSLSNQPVLIGGGEWVDVARITVAPLIPPEEHDYQNH